MNIPFQRPSLLRWERGATYQEKWEQKSPKSCQFVVMRDSVMGGEYYSMFVDQLKDFVGRGYWQRVRSDFRRQIDDESGVDTANDEKDHDPDQVHSIDGAPISTTISRSTESQAKSQVSENPSGF
jgi:hypothetical protein